MKFTYFLSDACKNTFVLFDCIGTALSEGFWKRVHEVLLQEQRDDALVLTLESESKTALYLKMHVLGADGKLGEFCGNGARSVAAYLFGRYRDYKEFYLVTKKGIFPLLSFGQGVYAVHLPKVQFAISKFDSFSYGEILEPHLALKQNLSRRQLFKLGASLNQNKNLFPKGININAWHVLSPSVIAVKTYERGVQRLTQSCGTGSCVCASLYLEEKEGKVFVKTPGGFLYVRVLKEHLELIGPAQFSHKPIEVNVNE